MSKYLQLQSHLKFYGADLRDEKTSSRSLTSNNQSVTFRLETSRYRDFSHFFESIGLGLEKKSRYKSQKYLVSKKSLGIDLENFIVTT